MLEFSLYRNATLSGDLIRTLTPVAGKPLHYTLDGVEFAPFFEGTADPFHSYFRRVEPRVVFGGLDSGVSNVVRDGTSFLDTVWSAAPFQTKTAFVTRVDRAADRFYTGDDRTRVTRTARHAPLWP